MVETLLTAGRYLQVIRPFRTYTSSQDNDFDCDEILSIKVVGNPLVVTRIDNDKELFIRAKRIGHEIKVLPEDWYPPQIITKDTDLLNRWLMVEKDFEYDSNTKFTKGQVYQVTKVHTSSVEIFKEPPYDNFLVIDKDRIEAINPRSSRTGQFRVMPLGWEPPTEVKTPKPDAQPVVAKEEDELKKGDWVEVTKLYSTDEALRPEVKIGTRGQIAEIDSSDGIYILSINGKIRNRREKYKFIKNQLKFISTSADLTQAPAQDPTPPSNKLEEGDWVEVIELHKSDELSRPEIKVGTIAQIIKREVGIYVLSVNGKSENNYGRYLYTSPQLKKIPPPDERNLKCGDCVEIVKLYSSDAEFRPEIKVGAKGHIVRIDSDGTCILSINGKTANKLAEYGFVRNQLKLVSTSDTLTQVPAPTTPPPVPDKLAVGDWVEIIRLTSGDAEVRPEGKIGVQGRIESQPDLRYDTWTLSINGQTKSSVNSKVSFIYYGYQLKKVEGPLPVDLYDDPIYESVIPWAIEPELESVPGTVKGIFTLPLFESQCNPIKERSVPTAPHSSSLPGNVKPLFRNTHFKP